ncbi:stAR-related lipid transfer protein 5-like isoform X1 [Corticium candelabrum]|uniref:stAR-related lipid transfer protein 5-like isoform X1 n=1 Tax=Corticium candelabrum TaxID=121492 RepID=UPI002E26445E|nr:stAR-related lipid transfer protein 5-like isoform X1 [Corticium candelabrum]
MSDTDARLQQADAASQKLLDYTREEWKVIKRSSGVVVSCRNVPDRSEKIYKGEGELDVSPEQALHYVTPGNDLPRKQWDSTTKEWREIEKIDKDTVVIQTITKAAMAGFIKGRDFVDVVSSRRLSDGTRILSAESTDHPQCPPESNHVRGTNLTSGLVCLPMPGEPNRTKLVFLIQSILGGMLPTALVESAMPASIIKFYTELRNALQNAPRWVESDAPRAIASNTMV